MKDIFRNKARGFYVTLACMALALITAIVYASTYTTSRYMSWPAFGIMLAGVALAAGMILLKLERFVPSALLVTNFLSLLLFVYYIYFYISSVVTGIQFSGFSLEFFVNIILYIATLAVSVVCVFLPQTNE